MPIPSTAARWRVSESLKLATKRFGAAPPNFSNQCGHGSSGQSSGHSASSSSLRPLAPGEQRRACDRRQPFLEQKLGGHAVPLSGTVAQRRIEAAVGEIDDVDGRIEIELQIRMPRDEVRQPRHQPARRHRRHRAQTQHVVAARAQRTQRAVDRIQMRRDAIEQQGAFGRQREPARTALEEAVAEPLLERAHLVAQRADGQVQALGGARQVLRAGGVDEDLQGIERRAFHLE